MPWGEQLSLCRRHCCKTGCACAVQRQELAQLQQRPELSRQASMRMVEWSLQALQYGALGPSERRMFVSRLLEGITAMSSMR